MIRRLVSVVIAGMMTVGGAAAAYAADCKDVRFVITNSRPTKVQLRYIQIEGNKGVWNENIPNQVIQADQAWRSIPQVLNKVDEGTKPVFMKVFFKYWDVTNQRWIDSAQRFDGLETCTNGRSYWFSLTKAN